MSNGLRVYQINDANKKSEICNSILRSLPKWFGIESAIVNYVKDVKPMETWAAEVNGEIIGFISLNKHNKFTAEIHVMGVIDRYHRQKIGKQLVERAEYSLLQQGFKLFSVKTLSESRPDEGYDKTRQFYLDMGFFPVEEFKTLWGEANPCLMLIKNLEKKSTLMSHVELYVSNYQRSIRFYEMILRPLGWEMLVCQKSHTTFSDGSMKLVLCPTEEKYLQFGFHRKRVGLNHLAFYAKSKEAVDEFYNSVIKANDMTCLYEGHPTGEDDYYSVFFEDPDRVKLEVVYSPGYCEKSHWTNQLPNDFISQDFNVKIEKARTIDIQQIKLLMESVFGPFPKLDELFTKWITNNQYSVQIARAEEKIIGVSTWCYKLDNDFSKYESFGKSALEYLRDQKVAWIVNLAVYPEYRRNKVGQRLSIAQFDWLKKQECTVVVGSSWVNGSNDHSQHLYLKAGFEKLGESNTFLRGQMQHGAICSVCKTSECSCNSILFGMKTSDLLNLEGNLR